MRSRRLLASSVALALLAWPALDARADEVLIYQTINDDLDGGDAAGLEAQEIFEAVGHDVTLVRDYAPNPMPTDLSPFDTVWIIQVPGINVAYQGRLIEYVKNGGGLYMTGERACCEDLNTSIRDIVGALLRPPFPTLTQSAEGGAAFVATAEDPFGITSTPNALPTWDTQAAGLISSVPTSRQVFQQAVGTGIGAALYPPEDFVAAGGCVYIAMDLTFWQDSVAPLQDLEKYVENIQGFLESCADSDHDGLTDEAETQYATDPDDPDSDDDGLCDGYGNVEGECVPGEHPLDNYDGDKLIPPLDPDDDNDGVPTAFEVDAEGIAPNVDGDSIPAWNDPDSDNDSYLDEAEGEGDYDNDGVPAIVDADDQPIPCTEDPDCGASDSGVVCNTDVGYCQPGCRGTGGNGCPSGEECTSDDETIGDCITPGEGGAGQGGAGDGGNGGAADGGGGSINGGSSEDSDGGCGCVVADEEDSRVGLLATLAMIGAVCRRRTKSLAARRKRR